MNKNINRNLTTIFVKFLGISNETRRSCLMKKYYQIFWTVPLKNQLMQSDYRRMLSGCIGCLPHCYTYIRRNFGTRGRIILPNNIIL
jgi:hypothetical protein